MHYYFNYRTLAFLFPSPFFLLWFHVYQSTQNIHSITSNSPSYKSPSQAGQMKAASVGIVVAIPTREHAMGNKTPPSRKLLGCLYSSIWLLGYVYQLYSSKLYLCCRRGGNGSQNRQFGGQGGHVLRGAISQGLVPCELTESKRFAVLFQEGSPLSWNPESF